MPGKEHDQSKYLHWIDPLETIPYERNAKEHNDRQVANIANSIRRFGWQQDTVLTTDKVLVIGHGRRLAAIKLGCMMPYHTIDKTADEVTDEDIRELRIADNQTNAETGFDWEVLKAEMEGLEFDGFDFDFEGLVDRDEEPPPATEDEYDPEPPENPISKPGDLWRLGEHRLLVGDSTNPEDVKRVLGHAEADLWITDPPYNVNYQGTAGTIQNDNQEDEQFREFLRAANAAAAESMRPGAAFYIWHADSEGLNFRAACEETGLHVRECLIWKKNSFVLGHSDYQWQHEPCLYGWKEGAAHYFTDSRSESTILPDLTEINPKKLRKEELVALLQKMLCGGVSTTVIEMDKPSRNGEHPTMKPVALFDYLIRNSTHKGDTVLDSFAGSGTTIMACEQNGRKARCMEIDPRYADVIIRRWETFTGKKGGADRWMTSSASWT